MTNKNQGKHSSGVIAELLVIALLSGCGGGGSSSSGSSSPPASGVPQNPPAPPVISYSGNRDSATLDESNAGALADLLYDGIFGAISVADAAANLSLPPPGVVEQRNQPGPAGGTVDITGRIQPDSTGWLTYNFTGYVRDGYTFNGQQVFEILQPNGTDRIARLSLYGLNVRSARGDSTYQGVITRLSRVSPDMETITGSMLFRVSTLQADFLAENIKVSRTEPPHQQWFELSGTGRLYHHSHGWLDWSFETPWSFAAGDQFPSFGGPAVGTNAFGRTLRVASLTDELASLQFSATSPAALDRTARVTWPTLFSAQTRRPISGAPIADAGASRVLQTGSSVELNAAFSAHPTSPFLHHRWRLLFRPPDSTAGLNAETAFNPRITLDQPGGYLLELEVSDGINTARDWVALAASDSISAGPQPQAQLVPGQIAAVGDFVSIDRSHFAMTSFDLLGNRPPSVDVIAPGGDAVAITTGDHVTTFTASERGVYQIVMESGAPSVPIDHEWLSVGGAEIPFRLPVWFTVPGVPEEIALADVDADGMDDIIASIEMDTGNQIQIIYNKRAPAVGTRRTLAGGGGAIAIDDLTSDGRVDIAAAFWGGVDVFAQEADGSFVHSARLTTGCFLLPDAGTIQIGDINGDGRNDLMKAGCGGDFEIALQSAQGTMGNLQPFDVGLNGNFSIEVGDLNADSIADVVIATEFAFDAAGHSIGVVYGSRAGPVLPVEILSYAEPNAAAPNPAIGDLNADGRAELVFSTRPADLIVPPRVYIYSQDPQNQRLVESANPLSKPEISGIAIGDINADGRMDLIEMPVTTGWLGVIYQQADGTFDLDSRVALSLNSSLRRAPADGIGDFNGDGAVDIAFRTQFGPREAVIAVLFGAEP